MGALTPCFYMQRMSGSWQLVSGLDGGGGGFWNEL